MINELHHRSAITTLAATLLRLILFALNIDEGIVLIHSPTFHIRLDILKIGRKNKHNKHAYLKIDSYAIIVKQILKRWGGGGGNVNPIKQNISHEVSVDLLLMQAQKLTTS